MKGNEGSSPVWKRLVGPQRWTHAIVAGARMASNKISGKVNGLYSPILFLAVWFMVQVELEVGLAANPHAFMDKLGLLSWGFLKCLYVGDSI